MITEKETKRLKFIINATYIALILGIIFFLFKYAFFWILPFLIAFTVSLMIDPIIQRISKQFNCKRGIISTLTIVVLFAVIILVAFLLSTTLIQEMKVLFSNLGSYLDKISEFIQEIPTKYGHMFGGKLSSFLNDAIKFLQEYDYSSLLSGSVGSGALKYAGNFITSLPSALIFFVVTIVATFFTSASFPTIKTFILKQFGEKAKDIIISSKFYFTNTVIRYVRSYFILMLITFAELSVAFLIFGFKSPITLALVISIVDVFPILGSGTVLIPWSIIELILGNPIRALILLCIYLAVTIIRQILEPKVISDHVGLMPIVTLFCIYIGLQLFGVIGMFLIPIGVIILKNLQDSGKIKIWK